MFRWDGSRKVHLRRILGLILVSTSLLPPVVMAQATNCHVPPRLSVPVVKPGPQDETRRVPITGYVLALSWSPEFCRDFPRDAQCAAENGRFGFIVHGLWPQGAGNARPQWCNAASVPEPVVRAQFCATPSAGLIAREWAKHGSCSGTTASDYFAASRKLFAAIRLPDMMAVSRRPVDVGGFKRLISAANPLVKPSGVTVVTERDGDWLREIRLCLTRDLLPQSCPRGQGGGAPDGAAIKIWRGGRQD
jgi:ribonuclease T2